MTSSKIGVVANSGSQASTSSATMQLISMIEVGKTDRFIMIVVKQNSIWLAVSKRLL